jgi:hypothetical protein
MQAQDIVQRHVSSLLVSPRAVFYEDNARLYTACLTTAFLTTNINTLPCPSLSPDINPIEHIWDELGKHLRARANAPATPSELFMMLQAEWAVSQQQRISFSIGTMPQRCQATIAARGGHTPIDFDGTIRTPLIGFSAAALWLKSNDMTTFSKFECNFG